mgnify:CR=1 FL=1
MKSGTRPAIQDPRDYSFHRTFGAVSPLEFPLEYNVDAGLTMPDQGADQNPYSCTAYATTDLGTDQDKTIYSPEYTYMKTLYLQGLPPDTNGSDIRPSLKSAKIYGLLPKINTPIDLLGKGEDFTANQAHWPVDVDKISGLLEHRKGDYYNIYDDGKQDWFDDFRSALWLNRGDKRGICIGTPWMWPSAPAGFLTEHFVYDGNPQSVAWHCWAIKGWTTIEGTPYLIGKPWLGKDYGANGWVYISRETLNKVMKIRGSVAFTQADATGRDIRTIQLGIIETILLYLWRMLGLKRYA